MMAAWWQSLAANERRLLRLGAVAAALLLGWALIWHPLAAKRVEVRQNVENQRRDLACSGDVHRGVRTGPVLPKQTWQ